MQSENRKPPVSSENIRGKDYRADGVDDPQEMERS